MSLVEPVTLEYLYFIDNNITYNICFLIDMKPIQC